MSSNMQRLGATLAARMKKTADRAIPTALELGTVHANLSISTDGLQAMIPKGEYMINLALTGGNVTGESDDGTHSHTLPQSLRSLKAGDRVLVAWCGNEPVVVAIVVSS